MPKARNRIKFSDKEIIFQSSTGEGYRIKPLRATGRIFVCQYQGYELEFELGEVGYVKKKKGTIHISNELYDMLSAYAFLMMRTVFAGYIKGKKEKMIDKHPGQLRLL